MFRRGCSRRYCDSGHIGKPLLADLRVVVDQISRYARLAADFNQTLGIRAVFRSDDKEQLAQRRDGLDGHLPILGCVANVLRMRSFDERETLLQFFDDTRCFVQAERGLSQVGDFGRVRDLDRAGVGHGFDEHHMFRGFT